MSVAELIESWRKRAGMLRGEPGGRSDYGRALGLSQAASELEDHLVLNEDELAVNIPQADYDEWYARSEIRDGVRVGPRLRRGYDEP